MTRKNAEASIGRKYCKPHMTPEERLAHVGYTVTDTGCWEWNGGKHVAGYGVLNIHGKSAYAHRESLKLKLGRDLGRGMQACHKCDNPPCMNPDHLFEGSLLDNKMDAQKKGRLRGGTTGGGKITYPPEVFRLVDEMRARGAKCQEISEAVGISKSYTYALLNGSRTRPNAYKNEENA